MQYIFFISCLVNFIDFDFLTILLPKIADHFAIENISYFLLPNSITIGLCLIIFSHCQELRKIYNNILIGVVLYSLFFSLFLMYDNYHIFVFSRIIQGFIQVNAYLFGFITIKNIFHNTMTKKIVFVNMTGCIISTSMPFIILLVSGKYGWQSIFAMTVFYSIIILLGAKYIIYNNTTDNQNSISYSSFIEDLKKIFANKTILFYMFFMLFNNLWMHHNNINIPVLFFKKFNIVHSEYILCILIYTTFYFIGSAISLRLFKRYNNHDLLLQYVLGIIFFNHIIICLVNNFFVIKTSLMYELLLIPEALCMSVLLNFVLTRILEISNVIGCSRIMLFYYLGRAISHSITEKAIRFLPLGDIRSMSIITITFTSIAFLLIVLYRRNSLFLSHLFTNKKNFS